MLLHPLIKHEIIFLVSFFFFWCTDVKHVQ
uniref:Uncharacterized protein n=1 Tax=Arundo donax TaxID=35708 RepID=A0A0A9AL70_ARUDO